MAETPEEAATVRRCQRTVIRALTGRCANDDVAEVATGLATLPTDHPDRAPIAAGMIMAWLRSGGPTRAEFALPIADLLPIAEADPPSGPQWEQARSMARVQVLMRGVVNGQVSDFAEIEAELAPMLTSMADNPKAQPFLSTLQTMAEFGRAFDSGDASTMHNMPEKLGKLRAELTGQPEMAGLLGLMDTAAKAMSANQRGEFTEALRHVEQLRDAVGDRGQDDVLRRVVQDSSAHMARFYQAIGDRPELADDPLAALEELADRPADDDSDRALEYLGLGAALLRAGAETDLARVDAAVRSNRAALDLTEPGQSRHIHALVSLAGALYRRSELAGNTDGLAEATDLVERARALLGGPHRREWTTASELLAMIRHRTGDIRGSGEMGLVAQRGYAWRALMESDAAGAKIAIGDAANAAVELARRCLYADNPADALRALDSGRGLMLFAATELHKVPDRLAAAGRGDLASRWAAEGRASSELRREVLAVLAEQQEHADKLLDPPSLDEIRVALTDLGADALVYLVPAESPQPGLALIAMADGKLAWMALPNLVLDATDGVEVEGYLAALADRSRDLAPPERDGRFTDRLDALCDWAWRAAMGPVLDQVFAARPPSDDRVPRVVLVPMGDLARIPWQAARRRDGVHAVELAAFTQAASARLLCENAARAPVGLSSGGLVVGDPDTGGAARELDDARLEAHAVRQSFYQGARYVGRRPNGTVSPSGAGTADEVRRWLTDQSPAAGAVLHLACHGSFATGLDDAKSALLLATAESGAGELSAEEIVDLLGGAPHRRVGLVVLAACNTGRSVHGYDEAYSLGTAFLAGSACSVLSTQWSIPDAQTPSLMYLFHHYCRRVGLPPWQALRQAQMWLLDPDRQPPEGMPAELLRSVPVGEPAPLAAWAGFVHYGH